LAQTSPQELSKRRTHSPEFKARVAMEAISGRNTVQVSPWMGQLLDGANELFTRGRRTKHPTVEQPKEAVPFQ
jgi:putative transposase